MDALDTSYDVVSRYIDELSENLLEEDLRGGERFYEPTRTGQDVGAAIDEYREKMEFMNPDAASDAYLARAIAKLVPVRLRVFDEVMEEGEVDSGGLQELLDMDAEPARARATPLVEEGLLREEKQDGIVYGYNSLGAITRTALDGLDLGAGIDAFKTLRHRGSHRLVMDRNELSSPYQLAQEADVSKRTAYNWRDGLVAAGYLEEDGGEHRLTEEGENFRESFSDVAEEIPIIASALQNESRLHIFLAAPGSTTREIAGETGMPLKTVQNVAPKLEETGVLDRVKEPGTVYRPGPYAQPVYAFYSEIAAQHLQRYREEATTALLQRFPSRDAAREAVTIAGVLAYGGRMADARRFTEGSYGDALRCRNRMLLDTGLVEKEGIGESVTYRIDPEFMDDIQRYIEVHEPSAVLEAGANVARLVDDASHGTAGVETEAPAPQTAEGLGL